MSKGAEIRFVKGKYAGMNGWINYYKKKKKNSVYQGVIVEWLAVDSDDDDDDYVTRVKEDSIRPRWTEDDPKTFESAVLMQHPDIEKAMIALAEMFAQCGHGNNNETLRMFGDELTRAKKHHTRLGNKARFRIVRFPPAVDNSL